METTKRLYVDFEPSYKIVQGKKEDTILLVVPGFSNEQLRVEVDADGNLKVRGERPLDGIRWSRFTIDFRLPPMNYDESSIQAAFEDDTLYVTLPKIIPPAAAKSRLPLLPPPPPTVPRPPPPPTVPPPPPPPTVPRTPPPPTVPPPPPPPPTVPPPPPPTLPPPPPPTVPQPPPPPTVPPPPPPPTNGLETPRRRTLLLNVAVSVAVLFGMGIYVIFKLTKPASSNERSK